MADALNLDVRRWQWLEYDRLYVTYGGHDLGWLDVKGGEATVTDSERENEFWVAIRRYLARHPEIPTPKAATEHGPVADLARNRAGAVTLARAAETRRGRRVRSTLERIAGRPNEEATLRRQARAERRVGRELERARGGWMVLHGVSFTGRDARLAHFLVGPGGAYAISPKPHPSSTVHVSDASIKVDDQQTEYIQLARQSARHASRQLSEECGFEVPVDPVIVFVDAEQLVIEGNPDGLAVATFPQLRGWVRSLPAVWPEEMVAAVYEAARWPDSWRDEDGDGVPDQPTEVSPSTR